MTNKNAYAQSGVDVEAGYEVVERIKKHVARTERAGVMGALIVSCLRLRRLRPSIGQWWTSSRQW